jgi:hypothetical protein
VEEDDRGRFGIARQRDVERDARLQGGGSELGHGLFSAARMASLSMHTRLMVVDDFLDDADANQPL